uniref:Cadherin 24, type 2a n=1 Tax=Astyanax mexicanus TaxID=7994 RepID=A0A8B9KA13_ASTMX
MLRSSSTRSSLLVLRVCACLCVCAGLARTSGDHARRAQEGGTNLAPQRAARKNYLSSTSSRTETSPSSKAAWRERDTLKRVRRDAVNNERVMDNEVPLAPTGPLWEGTTRDPSQAAEIRARGSESAGTAVSPLKSNKNSNPSALITTTDSIPNATDTPQSLGSDAWVGMDPRSRSRRSWIWNQFFVIEEYSGPEPVLIGRLHSSMDRGDGRTKYILKGEGAGSVFVIDGKTGNIHVTKPLDREEKDQYRLIATATDRQTGRPLEASSQFIIRVQDINDNPPLFAHAHYSATVPEMASIGTSVIQVTATDADDETYGNSAKLVYSVVQGQQYFTVDPQSGHSSSVLLRPAVLNSLSFWMKVQKNGGLGIIIRAPGNHTHFSLSLVFSCSLSLFLYSIDPESDPEALFRIAPDNGLITTVKELDREREQWHNITVIATQRDSPNQVTRVAVAIETLDLNDNAPELDRQYNAAVCDSSSAGQVVQVIRAIDKDQSSSTSPIHFSLHADSSLALNITVQERGDHTASLVLLSPLKPLPRSASPSLHTVKLPIILRDGASELSSTGTVTLTLCPCQNGGMWAEERKRQTDRGKSEDGQTVMEWERQTVCVSLPSASALLGLSSAAMLAVLACSSTLLVVTALALSVRRQKSDSLSPLEDDEIRENIITYDDEGGGEADTAAFDIAALKSAPHSMHSRPGSAPLYGRFCYSIHTLPAVRDRIGPYDSRLDFTKLAYTLPSGQTLNYGPLDPGSMFTGLAELSPSKDQSTTEEEHKETEDSAENNLKESETGSEVISETQNLSQDQRQASLHTNVSDELTPTEAPINTSQTSAPFRTMEGTLLRGAGGIPLAGTTCLYPKAGDIVGGPVPGPLPGRSGPNPLTHRMSDFLQHRLAQVTFDPMQPPYDSLQTYGLEGAGSQATSLSSLESDCERGTEEEEEIKEWGPKFNKLLEIFRERERKTEEEREGIKEREGGNNKEMEEEKGGNNEEEMEEKIEEAEAGGQ